MYFLILFFGLSSFTNQAKPNKSDSLFKALNSANKDSIKVKILHELYLQNDSLDFAFQALKLSEEKEYKRGIALALLDIGRWYYFAGKEDVSLSYLIRSVKIAEEINEKNVLKSDYRYIGFIYRPHEPFKAKEYYEKSLKMCLETGDELAASYALSAIGNIYEGIADKTNGCDKKALDFYTSSLKIREKIGSYSEIASSLNETSRMYDALGMYDLGTKLRIRGLQIAEKNNDIENTVYICNLLGNDFANRAKDYKSALLYQLKAFELGKIKFHNIELMHDVTKSIAYCYTNLSEYKKASEFFLLSNGYYDIQQAKEKKHDYNLSSIKQGLEKELERQKLLVKDAEILKEKAESGRQSILSISFIIGFIIVLFFSVFLLRAYRQKQKANRDLDLRNMEIEIAYDTLAISENKFKQITETINDVFYLYNIREKKYEYISPNCEALFGVKAKYFYDGESTKAIIHKDDLQIVMEANVKIDNGLPYDIEYRIIVNEQIKWIAEKSSPIFDEKGILIRNSGICRNITKRKKAEEMLLLKNLDLEAAYKALSISQSNFKQIADTIVNVFYLYNIVEKKYEYVSPNCLEILGIEQNYLYEGNSMKKVVFEDDLPLVINANVLVDSGIAYDIEYRVVVNNEIRWISEKSTPIFDENKKLIKNSGICIDVTRRKLNEVIIRKRNKDITDSIAYARTIQKAILVPRNKIEIRFKDFFILSKPKEIVSGDFYFYKETKNGTFIAAADCTGHGVPAGFMSMIGNAFLNEIINTNGSITPAQILDQLRVMIIQSLNQNRDDSESKDGLDIALLHIDKNKKVLQYAGAFNALYLVRNNELQETKADLFSVGMGFGAATTPFTNNVIDLKKDDALYVFSDGYISQFGGPHDKKFMKKQFQELLLTIQDKNMLEQEKALALNFDEWKGNVDQVDDVIVIGVKI